MVTVTKSMLQIFFFCDMLDLDLKKYLQMTKWLLPLRNKYTSPCYFITFPSFSINNFSIFNKKRQKQLFFFWVSTTILV